MNDPAISVVIPCYRSASTLPDLAGRVSTVLADAGQRFEIILVDDASPDDTWAVIRRLCGENPRLRGLNLLFNVGQFRATICGMEHAKGDLVLTMDDDLQQLPEDIPKLIDAFRAHPGVDCVIGCFARKRHSPLRNLGSAGIDALNSWLYEKPRDLKLTSFRLMTRTTAAAICSHRTVRPVLGALLLQCTRRIMNVDVGHSSRPHGRSGWTLRHLFSALFDNVVAGSTAPLRLVTVIGLVCATVSALLGIVYLTAYAAGKIGVPGFATQTLLIVFFGGATLFSIGLLGEYVARIVRETTLPPRYVIRDAVGLGP
jgi:dolichol-phosphate mannosyltransferase/undecaprenyl-phosphate 4-deoxy-4-formamido-L-arabinose transferase